MLAKPKPNCYGNLKNTAKCSLYPWPWSGLLIRSWDGHLHLYTPKDS